MRQINNFGNKENIRRERDLENKPAAKKAQVKSSLKQNRQNRDK